MRIKETSRKITENHEDDDASSSMTKMMKMKLMAMARPMPMLMITRRLGVGGRDVALFTGLWQQRDCGAEEILKIMMNMMHGRMTLTMMMMIKTKITLQKDSPRP